MTKTVTHTPGEWTARPDSMGFSGHDPYCDVDSPDGVVARVMRTARHPMGGREREIPMEANCHLIAAAPDLLKACEAIDTDPLLELYANGRCQCEPEVGISECERCHIVAVRMRARAAIHKARGQ